MLFPITGSPYSTYTSNEPRHWWSASMDCRHKDMQRLLGLNPKLVDWKNPVDGWTAMHYAAKFNNLAMVKLLLKYNANVNSRSRNGQTPLHVAVLHANPLVIRFLVEQCKADTSIMDFSGRLPAFLVDRRLPSEFFDLLSTGRIQRIKNDLKNLQPACHLSRHNSHHHSIKLLAGHGAGREFKRPLLPSMSMILQRGSAGSVHPSVRSTTSSFLPSSATTNGHSVVSTPLVEDDSAFYTMYQPCSHNKTATDEPASAAHSTIGRRTSVWSSLLHSTAAAATATGNHKTSSASLQSAATTRKMFRTPSTLSSHSDIRGKQPADNDSLVSLSSNCLPPDTGSSTIGHPRKHTGSIDSALMNSLPKDISASADLHLLSTLLGLLPPSTLSFDCSLPSKSKHKKHRAISRLKNSASDMTWLPLDGSGDQYKSSESVCKPTVYRSPSSVSAVSAGDTECSRDALLAPLARRRANSMLANTFAIGNAQRPTHSSSDSWLSQAS